VGKKGIGDKRDERQRGSGKEITGLYSSERCMAVVVLTTPKENSEPKSCGFEMGKMEPSDIAI